MKTLIDTINESKCLSVADKCFNLYQKEMKTKFDNFDIDNVVEETFVLINKIADYLDDDYSEKFIKELTKMINDEYER